MKTFINEPIVMFFQTRLHHIDRRHARRREGRRDVDLRGFRHSRRALRLAEERQTADRQLQQDGHRGSGQIRDQG
jgi:hypothetical protein